MTTTKVSMTTDKADPPADYADAIGMAAAAKVASSGFGDTLRSLPSRARAWAVQTMRTFRLDGAARSAGDGALWLWNRTARGLRFVRRFNLFYIAGSIATVPAGRNAVVSVAAAAYRVARKPFQWLHSGLSWICRKIGFGWGERQLAKGLERGERIENWVADKVDAGLDWLDTHDQHDAMRAVRGLFQFGLVSRALAIFFPTAPIWMRGAAAVAVPVVGDRAMKEAIKAEEAAIAKAHDTLEGKVEVPVKVQKPAKGQPRPQKGGAPAAPSITIKTVVMTDSRQPAEKATFETVSETNEQGVVRYRLGSQLLMTDDLPDYISVVGEHAGEGDQVMIPHPEPKTLEPLESTVRQSQANPSGRPPQLPRAARRAAARGKAPAKQ